MITNLVPEHVDTMPDVLQPGILYISKMYGLSIHLCACGTCNQETVLPFHDGERGWTMTESAEGVTFRPSIGNFNFPCKAHYHITNNKIEPCSDWKPQ